MNKSLKVLPPKELKKKPKFKGIHPHLWDINNGACIGQIGKVRAGKSIRTLNLFFNKNMYAGLFDIVFIFSPTLMNDPINKSYLKDEDFITFDTYSDEVLQGILDSQLEYVKDGEEPPRIAILFDDLLTMGIKQNALAWTLSSNYRHFGISLLVYNLQKLTGLPVVVRSNLSGATISKFNSSTQEDKLIFEFGEYYGGDKNFKKLYEENTKEPYSFISLKLDQNPAIMYKNWDKQVYPLLNNKEDNIVEPISIEKDK